MRIDILTLLLSLSTIAVSTGCGSASGTSSNVPGPATNVDASQYTLHDEPDGAVGVIEARESSEDGESLVLVGRIGGAVNPWIDGRAAFTLLDASMSVVAEGEDSGKEGELCMGDCCATERLECTTLVKVVDAQGRLVPVDSRELFGLKETDMVVVKGTAKKDKSGNFVMLAKGVFKRK